VVLAEKKTELKQSVPRNEFRRIIRDMGKKKEAGRG
jgi:RNase P protein component